MVVTVTPGGFYFWRAYLEIPLGTLSHHECPGRHILQSRYQFFHGHGSKLSHA